MPKRKVYLSHYDIEASRRLIRRFVEDDNGVFVVTNFQTGGNHDIDKKVDWRLGEIDDADVFIFFESPPGERQLLRSIELGFAIGAEVPVVFVGTPRNSYHRYGDVFATEDAFFASWRSSESDRLSAVPELSGAAVNA